MTSEVKPTDPTIACYRLESLLGTGASASVYAAVDENGNPFAIKVLHHRFAADAKRKRLFLREASVANRIRHPDAVPIIDSGETEDGRSFLVMPRLLGQSLAELSRTANARRSRLTWIELTAIAHEVLGVLQQAHEHGVIHRDIKPENLFETTSREIKVLDFGIGRMRGNVVGSGSLTQSGFILGTPAYMAPEQALGKSREIDPRTDIWSFGATLFALASGRHVHVAENPHEQLVYAATRPAVALSSVIPETPSSFGALVDHALEFERSRRWESADAMLEGARGILIELTGSAAPVIESLLPSVVPTEIDSTIHDQETLDKQRKPTSLSNSALTEPPVSFHQSGRVLVATWNRSAREDVNGVISTLRKVRSQTNNRLLYVGIVPATAPLPSGEAQKALARAAAEMREHCEHICVVLEGTGFRQSIMRTIVATMMLASGGPGIATVVSSLDQLLRQVPHRYSLELRAALKTANRDAD